MNVCVEVIGKLRSSESCVLTINNISISISLCLSVVLVNTLSNNSSMFDSPQTMKYELCLNGTLPSDILLYPLFHCHVRLLVIRVCSSGCLMSQSVWYPQLTLLRCWSLASVTAGSNTCGLTIVATLQHVNLGSQDHMKWLARSVYTALPVTLYASNTLPLTYISTYIYFPIPILNR